jgi:hypothetical protein
MTASIASGIAVIPGMRCSQSTLVCTSHAVTTPTPATISVADSGERAAAARMRTAAIPRPAMKTTTRPPPTIPSSESACSSKECGWRMSSPVRRARK